MDKFKDNFQDNEEEHKEVQNYAVYGDPVLMQNEDTEEEDIEESYYSSEEYWNENKGTTSMFLGLKNVSAAAAARVDLWTPGSPLLVTH